MFVLLDVSTSMPVLVKYDNSVVYLPVFESKSSAEEAARNLARSKSESVVAQNATAHPSEFSWSSFRTWHQQNKKRGIMLFVYPMSPADFGAS